MVQGRIVQNPSKNSIKRSWQKVKIKGKVVSDDVGGGLEGLIGLEVLEKYNKNLVTKEKRKRPQKREPKTEKKQKRRKLCESSEDDNGENEETPKKKKKKNNKKGKGFTNHIPGQFVLLKPPQEGEDSCNENEDQCKPDQNEPKVQSENTHPIDDLVGWNGLGVPDPILKAIAENGFRSPTTIQSLTLPSGIMGKKDILGAAETGSGKTLAFGIPILAGIMELKRKNIKSGARKVNAIKEDNQKPKERENFTPPPEELDDYPEIDDDPDDEEDPNSDKPLYALILTPTRELAVQVKDHIVNVAKYTGIKVAAIFGGLSAAKQQRILKQCPEIVVATPGRLWDLLEEGNPHLNKVDNISYLVIDETDRMVEKGHFEELRLLLTRLNLDDNKKQSRQNFVFSATLTLVHDLPDYLQKKNIVRRNKLVKPTPGMKIHTLIEQLGISQPKIVDITESRQTAQNLTECRIVCPIDHKDYYLYYFVQKHPGRTIVFCNSIDCVKRLAQLFNLLQCQPLPLHANMIQKQRLKNLEKFRNNSQGFLIATDVAARGLDIPDVQHVIHYQVPRTSENYVHRSGRTARANKDGITVMIMEPGEVKNYLKLCKTLDRSEDLPLFPVSEKLLKAVKERVNLAREIDKLELKSRREQNETGWMKKTAEEMDILLEDQEDVNTDLTNDDERIIEKSREKNLLTTRRQQLLSLLKKPIFPRGFSYKYPTSTGKLKLPFFENNETSDNSNSAVHVMKEAIEEFKAAKKQRNKKRKQ